MKYYVDAQNENLTFEARNMDHAMERLRDFGLGANMLGKLGDVDRISVKPSRKIKYLEVK